MKILTLPIPMPTVPAGWTRHRVNLPPWFDAEMKAMAEMIHGDYSDVFSNGMSLYFTVKKQLSQQEGSKLYLEDHEGKRTPVSVS